jgi:hypothetical protein
MEYSKESQCGLRPLLFTAVGNAQLNRNYAPGKTVGPTPGVLSRYVGRGARSACASSHLGVLLGISPLS